MNDIDRIKEPYDKLASLRNGQDLLAKTAIESNVPTFAGVWGPTDEKVYLVSETCLRELMNESR